MQKNKSEQLCANCIYRTKLCTNGDLLCRYHGVVEPSYHCRRHSADIFTNHRKKKRMLEAGRYRPQDFEL